MYNITVSDTICVYLSYSDSLLQTPMTRYIYSCCQRSKKTSETIIVLH